MTAPADRDLSEPERLRLAADGDSDAVSWLLDEVAPIVYGFVLGRIGSRTGVAEDLLQETLLEGLRGAGSFRGDSTVSTWLCTIARRRIARHYEAERKLEVARSGLTLVVPQTDDDEAEVDQREEVLAALARLPAIHRQVLGLKYLDNKSVNEIALMVDKTPVQVQSLLQRAREGLRKEMESADG